MSQALRRVVERMERDASLMEADELRRRLAALDELDACFPEWGREEGGELWRRARAMIERMEAANEALYASIRDEIRGGGRSAGLRRWVGARDAAGVGYDDLDELVSGVLQLEEPGEVDGTRDAEMVFYQPTPARAIFELMERTALTAKDVLFDLGSGMGHVPLLAAAYTEARCVGVEREAGYVACARRCAARLNLERVRFLQQDARATDFSGGTVFYLYTPFTGSILRAVLDALRREAQGRRIRVCSYGPCTRVIAGEEWLEAVSEVDEERVAVFCSRG